MSAKQLAFVIDLKRCIGCDTCVVACKVENDVDLVLRSMPVARRHGGPRYQRECLAPERPRSTGCLSMVLVGIGATANVELAQAWTPH